jgi:hypothetical protein
MNDNFYCVFPFVPGRVKGLYGLIKGISVRMT